MSALATLTRKLDYRFTDVALLECALTHRSAGTPHNERLEFLGDAILSYVIAEALYHQFPKAAEGDLSRLRASLVRGTTLAQLALQLQLGDHLRLGPGELKSGGFRRESILAGALESLFGAINEDGGYPAARSVILRLYQASLAQTSPETELKDPKTRLQEYLQAQRFPLPQYRVLSVLGEAHAQTFEVECTIETLRDPVMGRGASRRIAEQDAAQRTLTQLEQT